MRLIHKEILWGAGPPSNYKKVNLFVVIIYSIINILQMSATNKKNEEK